MNKNQTKCLLAAGRYRRINAEMRSIVAVLVIIVCVAVICESAAVSKHQNHVRPAAAAADGLSRWPPPGRAKKNRIIIPSTKHRTRPNGQKRKQKVSGTLIEFTNDIAR